MHNNFVLRCLRKFLPVADKYEGNAFIVKEHGKILFTPLFVVLLMIEISDVIFARFNMHTKRSLLNTTSTKRLKKNYW
jgi:predicted tellurium resistance membrane protein TerC